MKQDYFSAVDREGGDDHLATPVDGALDQLAKTYFGMLVAMDAIAVGTFNQQEISSTGGSRLPQDRVVLPAEVAAEPNRWSVVGAHCHRRSAEDVARRMEGDVDAIGDGDVATERVHRESIKCCPCIGLGVQSESGAVTRIAVSIRVTRLFLLQTGTVGQHHAHQPTSVGGDMYRAAKPSLHEARKVTAVIEVGVGDDHGVDRVGFDIERRPISFA